jgi:hypothetical protein
MATDNHIETETAVNRLPAAQTEAHANGAAEAGPANERMARAEEMVDRLAEKLAHFTSVVGRKVLWLGARLREEAEDIWTEAQSIRRGEQP